MTNQTNNQSIIPSTDVIQLTLTLKMITAQVVETSFTVNNNSSNQDYVHLDDQTQPTFTYLSYTFIYIFLFIFFLIFRRPPCAVCHPPSVSVLYRHPSNCKDAFHRTCMIELETSNHSLQWTECRCEEFWLRITSLIRSKADNKSNAC